MKDLDALLAECSCPESKKILNSYVESLIIKGLNKKTVGNHVASLTFWNRILKEKMACPTKEDLNKAFLVLESHTFVGKNGEVREYTQVSKNARKIHMRSFLKFIGKDEFADTIKVKRLRNKRLPEDLLTRDDVFALLEHAYNQRDKALISLLYESGARSGEILSLKIKNIERHEKGYYVHFPEGKTGARKILVIYSAKHLFNWLSAHPLKENRNAPLWVVLNQNLEPLNHAAFHILLRRTAKRAGIQKRVNPHSFRHAQATELAKDFTEQQMKRYLGWTQGSEMASIYVHLSGKDIDNAILQKNGIEVEERNTSLQHNECPRCHFISEGNIKYCGVCGTALTQEAAQTEEDKLTAAIKAILMDSKKREELSKLL
jgi:site-specific recombinase XerD